MKIDIKTVINYIAVFTIFSGGLTLVDFFIFGELRIIYFLMPLVLLLWIPFFKDAHFDRSFLWFFAIFAVIIIFSLINIFFGNTTLFLLTRQAAGIFLIALAFFLLFKINNYDVKKLFKIYFNVAFLVALIGLVQAISFLLGFKSGYDFSYLFPNWRLALQMGFLRVNSILSEPAEFCYVMTPAFFVSVASLANKKYATIKKWKSLVIVSAFMLTFSVVGYVGVFLTLALLIYNYRKIGYLLLLGSLLVSIIAFSWGYFEGFQRRIGDAIEVVKGEKNLEYVNLTTFAWISNAMVTYNVFLDSPIFGHGLGSRPLSYDKYIGEVVDIERAPVPQNREGGNSLLLRILSEMGLLGILMVFSFLFRFYLPRGKNKSDHLWVTSNAVLVAFLIMLIRSEHYFAGGVFFFFWLYYFTWKANDKQKKNHESRN